jgi:hypothetical protein
VATIIPGRSQSDPVDKLILVREEHSRRQIAVGRDVHVRQHGEIGQVGEANAHRRIGHLLRRVDRFAVIRRAWKLERAAGGRQQGQGKQGGWSHQVGDA